jgi:hypothetical protein
MKLCFFLWTFLASAQLAFIESEAQRGCLEARFLLLYRCQRDFRSSPPASWLPLDAPQAEKKTSGETEQGGHSRPPEP